MHALEVALVLIRSPRCAIVCVFSHVAHESTFRDFELWNDTLIFIAMSSDSSAMPLRRSQFRPCIDLHEGKVKQIVGGTLDLQQAEAEAEASAQGALRTNFVSEYVLPLATVFQRRPTVHED